MRKSGQRINAIILAIEKKSLNPVNGVDMDIHGNIRVRPRIILAIDLTRKSLLYNMLENLLFSSGL